MVMEMKKNQYQMHVDVGQLNLTMHAAALPLCIYSHTSITITQFLYVMQGYNNLRLTFI